MNKAWYKKWWGFLLIITLSLFLSLLVAFAFYIVELSKRINTDEFQAMQLANNLTQAEKYDINIDDNYWLGTAKPEITIVEFADFSCPLCQNSYSKIREIGIKYKDSVKIVHKDYPLYEDSINLAMAGRCAGEQGLFWLMYDKLFQNQGDVTIDDLPNVAMKIGADVDKFKTCLSSQKYLTEIQNDYSEGENLDLQGTPTWFINGYKIEGDIPYDTFILIIESLINS